MKKATDVMSKIGKWLLVFGFIFSQLSFPISVFADEITLDQNTDQNTDQNVEQDDNDIVLLDDDLVDKPVITINGEERTEYTIEDDLSVEVVLEYQGKKESKTFDFTNKLYGIYQYTFTSVDETVTISYLGNNASLLATYAKGVDFTRSINCDTDTCVLRGFGVDYLTVNDVTDEYYNLDNFSNYYGATVVVTDGDELLESTDKIVNGYQLKIKANQTDLELVNTTPETVYTISRVGDLVVDGLIDNQDQQVILDDILHDREVTGINDLNEDGKLNILDATDSLFVERTDDEVTDVLTNTLVPESKILFVGGEVKVQLLIRGFDKASLYGIEGVLSYNSDVLELNGAYLEAVGSEDLQSLGNLNLENNKFAYLLDGFNQNDKALLTLTFKAIAVGDSEVAIHNIIESYGDAFELANDSAKTVITVLDYNSKGGDGIDNEKAPIKEETTETAPIVTQLEYTLRPIVLSSDNYIRSLVIKGYEIDFNMYNYEYSIKVAHDVTSLDLDIVLNDSNSIYYVEGNDNFQDGENKVSIYVKAENGSTRTYTIHVDREKQVIKKAATIDEDEVEEENNTSKTIIIILIILVIIGLVYVIFKDDEEDAIEIKKHNDKQLDKTQNDDIQSSNSDENKKKKNKK